MRGINGCATVVIAVLATLLAIELGFTAVVALAVALYLLAAAVWLRGGVGGVLQACDAEAVTLRPGQLLTRRGRYKTIGLGSVSF